jgi:hypothetical protein
MTARRTAALAALLVAGGLAAGGCATASSQAAAPAAAEQPATLLQDKDGGPGVVRLSAAAEQRLGIRTSPVTAAAAGALLIPYGAVVYQPDGTSWAYVQTAPRRYQRQAITISTIAGDQATLSAGPPPGALVVSQGGAELVGVETGIDGEE